VYGSKFTEGTVKGGRVVVAADPVESVYVGVGTIGTACAGAGVVDGAGLLDA
jgi:hypothetical protein